MGEVADISFDEELQPNRLRISGERVLDAIACFAVFVDLFLLVVLRTT
jgi:hypothetical protein